MLEKVLGSAGRVALLRVIMRYEGRAFSLNELAELSGLSLSTAFKEVKDLIGVLVDFDPVNQRYKVRKDSLLCEPLKRLYSVEEEVFDLKRRGLFTVLSGLGFYYLTGSSSIILRGLSRDFQPLTKSIFIIGDRGVIRFRGALKSLFNNYRLLILEKPINPYDYVEGEIYFEGGFRYVNLAVLEKAVADALWKLDWEDDDIVCSLQCLMEQALDLDMVKKYVKLHGSKVEARLRWLLETVNRVMGSNVYSVEDLAGGFRAKKKLASQIEEAIRSVLGG